MKRREMVGLAAALLLAFGGGRVAAQETAAPRAATTVILVRHAEKASEPAADPPLTAAGEARAKALAEALANAGVSAVVTTQFARTRSTAAPLAAALQLTPEVVDARAPEHATAVAAMILAHHAGEVVLVVGHSNTIPAIVEALGVQRPAAICDAEYDGLYVVTVPASGSARLVSARYGAPTPHGAECAGMMR